jgi:glycosyltransferase involved in cell wall biosynthesis
MEILFLSDNFPPETNAPASRTFEHCREWVKAGQRVTVITGAPNFPTGKVFPGYRNRWYTVESMSGIRVVRVKTYLTANERVLKRTLDFLSFMVAGFLAGLVQRRPDVIIGTSPQFFTVCAAWMLSVCRWRPWVFELRDLWPASIVAVGAMRGDSLAIRLLEKLELFLYRRATAVVPVTPAFKANLVERGIASDKIAVVMNGVDLDCYAPRPRDPELATRYGLENKFVVGYLGTHGMAHALHRVLEAAERLRDRTDVVFLFAGGGAQRAALMQQAERQGLLNVRWLSPQPKELMPRLWSVCDVALIHLQDDPTFATVIPSKLFECMGMGLPVIMALPEGEATRIVRQTGMGVVVPPEQPAPLAAAVVALAAHPDQMETLRQASRAAASSFIRAGQAEKMLDVLAAVAVGTALPSG